MHKEINCEICHSTFAQALLYLNYCNHVPYFKLIEQYEDFIPRLNLLTLSNHFNHHIEQSDIKEVEALFAEYESW